MTLEDPPHESPRPPTLKASHLLTGPTGCPGFEFPGLLRTIRRRARHRVTICRELIHYDQINKSEHGETDRRQKNRKNYARCVRVAILFARDHPRPVQHGGGGRIGPDANMRVSCSVPCVRLNSTCRVLPTLLAALP